MLKSAILITGTSPNHYMQLFKIYFIVHLLKLYTFMI